MKMLEHTPVGEEREEKTLGQIRTCAAPADRAALTACGHLGYVVPIGDLLLTIPG
jgi:hypothetical protein